MLAYKSFPIKYFFYMFSKGFNYFFHVLNSKKYRLRGVEQSQSKMKIHFIILI